MSEGPQGNPVTPANVVPLMDGQGMLVLLLAKGIPRWEAVGMVAGAHWRRAVQPLWERHAKRVLRLTTLLKALDQVAIGAPATANAWLGAWLLEREVEGMLALGTRPWVTSLPEGLQLRHGLFLQQASLRHLPPNLKVGGNLYLSQSLITTLPPGLAVSGSLWLRACLTWDGRIPADTLVGRRVFTDRHKNGLPLADWRAKHPDGERG